MTTTVTTPSARPATASTSPTLFATLDAVKGQNEIAKFQFRATNTWVSGTHSRSTVLRLLRRDAGDGAQARTELDADHPAVLVGQDKARRRSSSCCTPSPPA